MTEALAPVAARLTAAGQPAVLVTVREARGSTPREAGTRMIVAADRLHGTIGGGRLEWAAADRARAMMAAGEREAVMSLPLGPAVGQCCGGHVVLALAVLDADLAAAIARDEAAAAVGWPTVLLFGAGHVGIALSRALAPLPLALRWYDERADAPMTAMREDPAAAIAAAPPGAAAVVMTHEHRLDYAITEAALVRGDFAYVGMIGSATKRARFCRGFIANGNDPALLEPLICPIGGRKLGDKSPPVIAALVAAELLGALIG
ncbi:xanthine dehydrogenase accessory protein XdhC [Zavarzinia compransoris]|uniref:xanthine dehydrogenase accessory protein XdhC n=1 Tax=Zavarzinia marina TaxID=2911065 RepID=UPI001F3322CB|nr:xanthine dehydrogenase accessory protein XdhC [Zavarzinia marina]MCF4164054.1 xanthine dehydrogenase accessory protein XdhC [Zavarzinia marina]